jgi:hypothetical protein
VQVLKALKAHEEKNIQKVLASAPKCDYIIYASSKTLRDILTMLQVT